MEEDQANADESPEPEKPAAINVEAFAHFSRFRPALVRYFERRMPVETDAQDLAHETLMRLARQPLETIRQPEAYLFQTAANVLRDQWRKDTARHTDRHASFSDDLPGLETSPSEERIYEGQDALRRLTIALNSLPPRGRSMFVLHRYAGLSYSEIARRFGVSVSSVEKHLMRALLQLKHAMKDA